MNFDVLKLSVISIIHLVLFVCFVCVAITIYIGDLVYNFCFKIKKFFTDGVTLSISFIIVSSSCLIFGFVNTLIAITTIFLIGSFIQFIEKNKDIITKGNNLFNLKNLNISDFKELQFVTYTLLASLYFFNVFTTNILNDFFSFIFSLLFLLTLTYSVFLYLSSEKINLKIKT